MKRSKQRMVLLACVGIQFLSGILYAWSVVRDQFVGLYGWSATEATLPYTGAIVVSSVTMFVGGLIHDHKGPRVMLSVGTLLLGAGLMLVGFSQTVPMAVLSFGLVGGTGVGINHMATTPAAVKWYPLEKKGMITGLVIASIAVASVVYTPIIRELLARYGLQKGFLLLGSVVLLSSFILAQFVSNPPEEIERTEETDAPSCHDLHFNKMLRTSSFYKLFIMFAFASASGLMIIGHLTSIANLQAGWESGYLLILLIAVCNALGRILGGALSDRIGRLFLMRMVFISQAINLALFFSYRSIPALLLGVVIAGLNYGASSSAFPAITADYYGLKHFGANFGLLYMAWGLAGIFGPLMAGWVVDHTGRYDGAYLMAAVMLLIAATISFTLKEKRHLEEEEIPFYADL